MSRKWVTIFVGYISRGDIFQLGLGPVGGLVRRHVGQYSLFVSPAASVTGPAFCFGVRVTFCEFGWWVCHVPDVVLASFVWTRPDLSLCIGLGSFLH